MADNGKSGVKSTSINFGGLGWLLIIYMALTFFITGLGGSVQNITAYVFQAMYGWDSSFVVSLNSIGGWVGTVFIFIFGIVMAKSKLNLRATIFVSAVVIGICYMVMGNTPSLVLYAALFIIYQIFYMIWAQLANQALLNNWFPHKKGVAVGWATMGFPLAPSLGLVAFSAIMGSTSVNTAYIILGAAAIIIGVLAVIIFRSFPEQQGRFPDNDKSMTREQANKELEEGQKMIAKSPWTIKRLFTTKEVWMIFVPSGFIGFFAAGSISQVVPRLLAAGYSSDDATGLIAMCALIAVPGSFLIGFLDSKFGTKKAYMVSMIMVAVGCLLYSVANPGTIIVGLIIIGIALGGSSNFAMSFTTAYFGRYHFQKAFGVTLTINMIVSNAGAIFIAYMAASFGWAVPYIAIAVVSIIMIFITLPVKDNFAEKYEAKFAEEDAKKA